MRRLWAAGLLLIATAATAYADSSPALPEATGRAKESAGGAKRPFVRRTAVPRRAGWFLLPNGYEITWTETTSRLLMRHDGVKVPIDAGLLAHRAFSIQHLEEVWVAGDGEVGLELGGEHFYEGPRRERSHTTLAHLTALYHLARARAQPDSIDEWRRAATGDPTLSEAAVGLARALGRSGDRAGAVEALLGGTTRETFVARYIAASLERELDWMRDEPRICERLGPREPPVSPEHITYSPRVELATWRHSVDSESDDPAPDPLMVGTLGGRVVTSAPMDSAAQRRRLARALGDLGFHAARLVEPLDASSFRGYDDASDREGEVPEAWNRALRRIGAEGVRAVADEDGAIALRAGGATIARGLSSNRMTHLAWLPEARTIVQRVMPQGPCTVGGAPPAESYVSFFPIVPSAATR